MADILEVAEGMQYQSTDEELAYKITTTNWVSSPTTPTVVVYDHHFNTDVTADVGAITASAAANVITLSVLKDLTKGHLYRVEVKWTVGSNIYECYFKVKCDL